MRLGAPKVRASFAEAAMDMADRPTLLVGGPDFRLS
jgi:hypothetical protein